MAKMPMDFDDEVHYKELLVYNNSSASTFTAQSSVTVDKERYDVSNLYEVIFYSKAYGSSLRRSAFFSKVDVTQGTFIPVIETDSPIAMGWIRFTSYNSSTGVLSFQSSMNIMIRNIDGYAETNLAVS